MATGVMTVTLINARDLTDGCFMGGTDAYVLLEYKDRTHTSKIAKEGDNPVWNEKFDFEVEETNPRDHHKLILKAMDHDTFTADDYLGKSVVYLKEIVKLGLERGVSIPAHKHIIVDQSQNYAGEIQIAIEITPKGGGRRHDRA